MASDSSRSGARHCPHGCGDMIRPVGDPLEPEGPYCPECGHIKGNDCDDGCHFDTETDQTGADDIEFATADLFTAISNQRRRFVILLVDHYGRMRVGEVAEKIAAYENDPTNTDRSFGDVRKAVYIGLTQTRHAEKVAEAGLVEYDSRAKVLSPSPLTSAAAEHVCAGYDRFGSLDVVAEVLA